MVNGKLEMIVDDNYEVCRKNGDPALFDISQVKLEQYNDTYTFTDGTIKFMANFQSPVLVHGFAEREMKGKWEKAMMDRKIPDICPIIQNPKEIWYFLTQYLDHKECPFPDGIEVTAGRIGLSESQIELHPFMIGNWRATLSVEIKNGLKIQRDCYRFYFKITEM
ncbi:unnamed protein product [Diamesa tonsa]